MNELALFAGGGGGILGGIIAEFQTVCAVEWEPYTQAILLARQADGQLEQFPIWDDVKTFDGTAWSGKIDIITAGFPCQPFSTAGKREGENDERNMWPDTLRILGEVRPRFALLENVPGLLTSGYFGTILRGLAESGFDARWRILSASELGAPHQRDRLWILAYPDCLKYESAKCENKRKASGGFSKTISNTDKSGTTSGGEDHRMGREPQQVKTTDTESQFIRSGLCEDESGGERRRRFSDSGGPNFSYTKNKNVSPGQCQEEIDDKTRRGRPFNGDWWAIEPRLGRVAHGVAHRVDRLKAIGNGQVPHVAARAWELLSEGLI